MSNKTSTMAAFANQLALDLFGMSIIDAHRANVCVQCKHNIRDERGEDAEATGEPGQVYSDAGFAEYCNSALCETCFDNIMGGN